MVILTVIDMGVWGQFRWEQGGGGGSLVRVSSPLFARGRLVLSVARCFNGYRPLYKVIFYGD